MLRQRGAVRLNLLDDVHIGEPEQRIVPQSPEDLAGNLRRPGRQRRFRVLDLEDRREVPRVGEAVPPRSRAHAPPGYRDQRRDFEQKHQPDPGVDPHEQLSYGEWRTGRCR